MHASTWHVRPGQRVVTSMHPRADEIVTILTGSAVLLVFDQQPPRSEICYQPEPGRGVTPPPAGEHGAHRRIDIGPGEVGLIPAGTFCGLENVGDTDVVAVSCVGPDVSDTVWTVREVHA